MGEKRGKQILAEMYFAFSFCQLNYPFNSSITKNAPKYFGANFEYIKLDRDKSTFKSHRDFSSEIEITFKHF